MVYSFEQGSAQTQIRIRFLVLGSSNQLVFAGQQLNVGIHSQTDLAELTFKFRRLDIANRHVACIAGITGYRFGKMNDASSLSLLQTLSNP
ncbi:hypothetical protein D3C75_963360 [compost metagenome]